jgi:serine/threonine protein kinase
VFGIQTTYRIYYIQCSDEENMLSWMKAVSGCLTKKEPVQQEKLEKEQQHQMNENKKISVDDFRKIKVIGKGGFGRVLLVEKKDTKKVYAMKILKKGVIAARGEIEHTRTEKSVLSKLDHPFLAKLHWSFQTDENLYFVMDFINGGELFHHLSLEKRFSDERAKFYASEIVSGMEYLHAHGVIYRDLKPENLLLSHKGHIIMTDFGLSKEGLHSENDRTGTFCGTPEYLAPEIIKGEDYTKSIDWWSVGTLIYEMLTGLPPFYTDDEENMYHKIMTSEIDFSKPLFTPEAQDIIRKFLNRDPTQRLQDPQEIKSHPWFRNIDWVKLEKLEITPPFIPSVRSADDVSNIDEEFLRENVNADDDDEHQAVPVKKEDFINFTFAADKKPPAGH